MEKDTEVKITRAVIVGWQADQAKLKESIERQQQDLTHLTRKIEAANLILLDAAFNRQPAA